ncbi:MAG: LytTR family DNA-binding domain-containing protein [Chitinophagaceae bacterium]
MPYSCIAADDDSMEREMLISLLEKIPAIGSIVSCRSALEVTDALQRGKADIVFSDIDMPDMSGMELLKSLPQPPAFVFITSYPDYAAESYDLDAVDYIVKPVTLPRLIRAVNKTVDYLAHKQQAVQQPEPSPVAPAGKENDSFYIKETKGYTRLQYSQVIYIESMGDFCRICTTEGKIHIVLVSLKNIETQLPEESFVRVQKQFIINIHHIRTITTDTVGMTNGHEVQYSTYYKQKLMDLTVNMNRISRFG